MLCCLYTESCCGMSGFAICVEGRVVACKAVLAVYRVVFWHVRFCHLCGGSCCGMLGFAICIEGRVVACKAVLSV